ncbi:MULTISPECIES: DUF305 domain-containing protein [unclassified Cyanobium]|uniref:DUF305 domain-containing protein n=1 Tax=unclassified Cyanobium TaxID=2627006 RepID=UPI0020CCABE9|nr:MULTISPECIES: DUF305 domain-containing protein [unclassified Cyanobium]MCP9777406.1 DUF305 domain-containing protein [Cyanobium sp. Tous-M-B4]MCP9876361.1 DUF305 domain-containing protein [Cyanobium sp. A2C-AMD]
MANTDPPRRSFGRPALLLLATGGILTVSLWAGGRCLSQGWSGDGMPGHGGGVGGPGQIGMGYSDQHFIVMMIPHHDGAIAMADLALTRAKRPEIKALAKSIKVSQTRENAQMRDWYWKWFGQDVSNWGLGTGWGWQNGMGMGMGMRGGMGGGAMGGGTNLSALSAAPDFDRAFIEQMIPHHQMGVMMASMAQTNSQHPELRQLQQAMVRVQSDEIQQMTQWYRSWYGTP